MNELYNTMLTTILKYLRPSVLDKAVKDIKKEEEELGDESDATSDNAKCDCHEKTIALIREVGELRKKLIELSNTFGF